MRVVSTSSFPVGSFLWQPEPGAHVCVIVVKIAYMLLLWRLRPAETQDDIEPHELVPPKPHVEISFRGRAYPPREHDGGPFRAALAVGLFAKTFDLSGDDLTLPAFTMTIPELRENEFLGLDNLHPDFSTLTMRPARLKDVRATLERPDHDPHDIPLRCDTVSIDTDRSICTVIRRGIVTLEHPDQDGTVVVSDGSKSPTPALPTMVLPRVIESFEPPVDETLGTLCLPSSARGGDTVPFPVVPAEEPAPPEPCLVLPAPDVTLAPLPERDAPVLPFVPPAEPLPPEPEPPFDPATVPLERFAAIEAELAERPSSRDDILHREELDEPSWQAVQAHWRATIASEVRGGSTRLRDAYDAAYVQAVEGFRGPIELDEYARIVIAIERGRAGEALEALHIHRLALLPIVRCWTKKTARDPRLSMKAMEAIRAARCEGE